MSKVPQDIMDYYIKNIYLSEMDFLKELTKEELLFLAFNISKEHYLPQFAPNADNCNWGKYQSLLQQNKFYSRNICKNDIFPELFKILNTHNNSIFNFSDFINRNNLSNIVLSNYYKALYELFSKNHISMHLKTPNDILDTATAYKILHEYENTVPNKPCSTIFFTFLLLDSINNDLSCNTEDISIYFLFIITDNYSKICSKIHNEHSILKDELKDEKDEISKLKKSSKEVLNKLHSAEKVLTEQNNLFNVVKAVQLGIKQNEELIKNSTKEIKAHNINIQKSSYENIVDRLTIQISDLRENLKEKNSEVKNLKKTIETLNGKSIKDSINEYVKNQLCNKDQVNIDTLQYIYSEMEPYYTKYIFEKKADLEAAMDCAPPKVIEKVNRIGYCIIKENLIYGKFHDETEVLIENIPEHMYLSHGQFILVDPENNFKYAFNYLYDYAPIKDVTFVKIKLTDCVLCEKPNGTNIPLKYDNINMKFKESQIIGINDTASSFKLYKELRQNADFCMPHLKIKGHKAYLILNIFSTGIHVRDIDTDKEEILNNLNLNDIEIKEHGIICVKNNDVVNYFKNIKFYTLSKYYTRFEYASIEHISDDEVLAKKFNSNEIVKVLNIPNNFIFYKDYIVLLDEFNNLIKSEKTLSIPIDKKTNKDITATSKNTNLKPKLKPTKIENILILGNLRFEDSYKNTLFQAGYMPTVLDGFSPWYKVSQYLKEANYVVIILDHISHDNMFRIKDTFNGTVIYSEFSGANRILEQLSNSNKLSEAN